MSKLLTISLDEEIYACYLSVVGKGNVTKDIQTYMQSRSSVRNESVRSTIIDLKELELLEEKKKEIDQKVSEKRRIVDAAESAAKEEEIAKFRLEQEAAIAAKKCIACGDYLSEKLKNHKFKRGFVCNGCFLSSNSESVKGWNGDQ